MIPTPSSSRRISSERSAEALPFSGPEAEESVSLRSLKRLAGKLAPAHPLRAVLLNEPDELPWNEYVTKAAIWAQLMVLKED